MTKKLLAKFFSLLLVALLSTSALFAQEAGTDAQVNLQLKYNFDLDQYEVYMVSDKDISINSGANLPAFLGSSQITVVFPAATVDDPMINVTCVNPCSAGNWNQNVDLPAPPDDPTHDFYAVASPGGPMTVVAEDTILLFTFETADGCIDGVRLFNTGGDPDPGPGMNNGDFRNNMAFQFPMSGFFELYNTNIDNDGIVCDLMPIANPDMTTTNEDTPVTIQSGANDTEGNDPHTISITDNPNNGTATINDNGTPNDLTDDFIIYTPAMDFNGMDTLIYEVCDLDNDCDTALVVITVNPVADPPVANPDVTTTPEDTPVTINSTNNDTDPDNDLDPTTADITCAICTTPVNGMVAPNGDGTFTYTPNNGFNGMDTFIYQVCDLTALCDTSTVIITVTPVNDPPVVPDETTTTPEDTPVIVCVSPTDPDVGDVVTVQGFDPSCGPSNGTVTDPNTSDFCVMYQPDPNFNGMDTFCVIVCDDGTPMLCDTNKVVVTVTPVNDPPVVPDEMTTTPEDTPVTVCVSPTDPDVGDVVTVQGVDASCGPNNGNLTDPDPSDLCYTYTPNPDFFGNDTFCVIVCDDGTPMLCDTNKVVVTVTPVNDPPVVPDEMTTTPEDTPVTVCVSPTDPDVGDVVTIQGVDASCGPNNGTLTDPDPSDLCYTYTPNPNFFGNDTFCVIVCDDGTPMLCDTNKVVVTVTPVNDPPVVPDEMTMTPEDTPVTVCVSPTDPDVGDVVTVQGVDASCGPNNGTLTDPDPSDLCYTYTPNPDFFGNDTFCVIVCDDGTPMLCDTNKVVVTVTPDNDPPVVPDEMTTTPEDTPVTVCVSPTDPDVGDVVTVQGLDASCGPNNGTMTDPDPSDLCYTYTPNPNFFGNDTFCVIVCDDGTPMLCDTSKVVVTVTPVNDPPVVPDEMTTTPEDTPVTVCVSPTDPDAGDVVTVQGVDASCGPNNGTLTDPDPSDLCYTYTPNPDFFGNDTFCVIVCDDGTPMLCDTNKVVVTVTPENDPPVVPDEMTTTPEDTPVTVCVSPTDPDVGDVVTVQGLDASCGPNNGTMTDPDPSDLCYTYTPNPNFFGNDTFCVIVCDDGTPMLCDTSKVVVTVTPVNDPPVVPDEMTTTPEDTPVTVCVSPTDPDAGDVVTVQGVDASCGPNNGTLTDPDPSDLCYTYTPNPDFFGNDTFCVIVCDDGTPMLCDTNKVVVTVTPENDPPVVPDEMTTTPEDTPVTVCVSPTDPDVGDVVTVQGLDASCGPNNGTLTDPDPSDLCYTYTPNPNFFGNDTFCVIVCDDGTPMLCDTSKVVVTVTPVNDPPVVPDEMTTTPEDTPVTVCVSPTDPDAGDVVTVQGVDASCGPNNGTLTDPDPSDLCYTYTPNPDFFGNDTFCVIVCDDGTPMLCDTNKVVVTVTPENDPPVVPDEMTTTPEDTPVTVCVSPTDPDVGDVVTVQGLDASCGPNNGTLTDPDPSDLCYTYTPNPNFFGNDTFCVIVCDDGTPMLCDTSKVVVTVTPVNDPPVVPDEMTMTPEDTPVTVCVSPTDPDAGDVVTVQGVDASCGPNNGTLTDPDPSDLCYTYTPNPDFFGNDTFCVIVCDNGTPMLCDTNKVVVTVMPVNDKPIAMDNDTFTVEDTPITVSAPGVLNNDTDPDNDPLTVDLNPIMNPMHGNVMLNADGGYTYSPTLNFIGMDTFSYRVCDVTTVEPQPLCDTAIVVITITPANDRPFVPDEVTTTPEDTPVDVCVSPTDPDAGDVITFFGFDPSCGPSNGTIENNDMDFCTRYTPDANFVGMDTFCVIVCDDAPVPLCDTAMIVVTVTPVNDPPVANPDTFYTPEDTPIILNIGDSLIDPNDFDIDGFIVESSFQIMQAPEHGNLVILSLITGNMRYTPDPHYNGLDTFIYQICDNGSPVLCDMTTVYINISPVNDPPMAIEDFTITNEDTQVCFDIVTNDNDNLDNVNGLSVDVDPASVLVYIDPANGNVDSYDPLTGIVCYTPDPGFSGLDVFFYSVCDTSVGMPVPLCDSARVTINIMDVNDPPVAGDDMTTTPEDVPVSIPITDNDMDPDGDINNASVTIIDPPDHGDITGYDPTSGDVIYTPDPNYNGMDTFAYQVCDDGIPAPVQCDIAQVVITIVPTNDPPVVPDEMTMTPEDTPIEVCLSPTDIDAGDVLTITGYACNPNNGTVTPGVGGPYCLVYTPGMNFNGVDSFCVIVCDNGSPVLCDTNVVIIEVTPVNDPPVAVDDMSTTPEDTPITVVVLGNDMDPDGILDPLTVDTIPGTGPNNGTVVIQANGDIAYTPDPDFNGVDSFDYRICDDGNPLPILCDTARVYITITPVNDVPDAVDDDMQMTNEGMEVNIPVLVNDMFGGDGPSNGPIGVVSPISMFGGMVFVDDNGSPNDPTDDTIDYTPASGFFGVDSFDYYICDVDNDCDTATVFVNVIPTDVRLNLRVMLQGALFETTGGLMRDSLRVKGFIPLVEPYSGYPAFTHVGGGNELISDPTSVFSVSGPNAIVDWVFVEIRDETNPTNVLATRSGLVQRDGDVVDVDGVSPLLFESTAPTNYYVSVRHRNHLGAMTSTAIPLTATGTLVDFTLMDGLATYHNDVAYDGLEQVVMGGVRALWAGNSNQDDKVKYQGGNNDANTVANDALFHPNNTGFGFNFDFGFGYYNGDVNLDGKVKYQGGANDANRILNNVLFYPLNTSFGFNYDFMLQQLP